MCIHNMLLTLKHIHYYQIVAVDRKSLKKHHDCVIIVVEACTAIYFDTIYM